MLHLACRAGDVSLVRTLILKYKSDLNARNRYKSTPIIEAATSDRAEVVLTLIREFGVISSLNEVLHLGCYNGNINLVRTLVTEYKADVTSKMLHTAALHNKEDIVLMLIEEMGCDVNVTSQSRYFLHSSCQGCTVNLVRILINKYRFDINARDEKNNTPVHLAALNGKNEIVVALIEEFGCDTSIRVASFSGMF